MTCVEVIVGWIGVNVFYTVQPFTDCSVADTVTKSLVDFFQYVGLKITGGTLARPSLVLGCVFRKRYLVRHMLSVRQFTRHSNDSTTGGLVRVLPVNFRRIVGNGHFNEHFFGRLFISLNLTTPLGKEVTIQNVDDKNWE